MRGLAVVTLAPEYESLLKCLLACAVASQPLCSLPAAEPAESAAVSLPMKEPRLTEAQARERLAEYAGTWAHRAAWEARAANIAEGILRGATSHRFQPL